MAFRDTPIPKRKACRLLGYSFPYITPQTRMDKSIVFTSMNILNRGQVYLEVAVTGSVTDPDDYHPWTDFCFECASRDVLCLIGRESVKRYTGYSVDQLIDLVHKAEAKDLLERQQAGIPAGATLPTVAPCPPDIRSSLGW